MATLTQARRPAPNHVRRAALPSAAPEPLPEQELNADGWLRVDLEGDYAGYHILVDPEELNVGLIEDITEGSTATVLTALTTVLVGGDIPKGIDRPGLRRLKAAEAASVIAGVIAALGIPKRR